MHSHHHGINAESAEELRALTEYMLSHNVSHAEELKDIASLMSQHGFDKANRKALEAIEEYNKGNALLQQALELMK